MPKKKNKTLKNIGLGLLTATGVTLAGRGAIKFFTRNIIKRIMTEPYDHNLWEVFSAGARTTPQVIVETSLRAETKKPLLRPLGIPKKLPDFDSIMFNIAQLENFPTPEDVQIDTSVTLGKKAARPLCIDIPIIIGGMAWGLALSEKAKIALAKGASMAGTATNTGYGPFLPKERAAAKYLIIQYNRGKWAKEPEVLKQADMIEIQLGQSARAGLGEVIESQGMDRRLIKALHIKPGQKATMHATFPELTHPEELGKIVKNLRKLTGGIPIGIKMGAGNSLEKDLSLAIKAGIDVITLCGSEGGSSAAIPIIQNNFGLPTIYALSRAAKFLEQQGVKDKVSLIISGGLSKPGDYLKALALGADAVAIGTIALFAMSHTQVLKALPFEPPIELVFYNGKYQKELNVKKGAQSLANYLKSTNEEIKEAIRALGKTGLNQVGKEDLFALDQHTADVTGLQIGY
ncbi:FMN-binding glutamate synthase family protein [Desulfolucanica intricata]|uniref:FMN-binding glutamate synthase family protein n=1 Tax=Desulfolucanica intricata TaxID=1285191 RepID=UPI0008301D3B|nr:FMN-binding glutamate synthase family protein [Desulfolucanica intricata]